MRLYSDAKDAVVQAGDVVRTMGYGWDIPLYLAGKDATVIRKTKTGGIVACYGLQDWSSKARRTIPPSMSVRIIRRADERATS